MTATHPLSNELIPGKHTGAMQLRERESTCIDHTNSTDLPPCHPVIRTRTPSPLGGKDAIKDGGSCSRLRSKLCHILQNPRGPAVLGPWTQQVSL